jgi:hypothetical protein
VDRTYVSATSPGRTGWPLTGSARRSHPGTIPHEHPSPWGGTATPETLHDALSLGMAVRQHWQMVRRQAGSDHDLGTSASRPTHRGHGHRRPPVPSHLPALPAPPDPSRVRPWVIDNDADEGEIRCGTELRATTGLRGTAESICSSGHRFVRCHCEACDCTGWRAPVTPGPHMPGIVP